MIIFMIKIFILSFKPSSNLNSFVPLQLCKSLGVWYPWIKYFILPKKSISINKILFD